MEMCLSSSASASGEGENCSLSLPRKSVEFVNAVCQVMISALRKAVQAELRLVHEDLNELQYSTTEAVDHISVRLDDIENIKASSVVSDEVAQLRRAVSFMMEVCNALPNRMDLRLSRVADRLVIV